MSDRPGPRRRPRLGLPGALALLAGLFVTVVATLLAVDDRRSDEEARFLGQADRARDAIRGRVDARLDVLEVLRDSVTTSWPIDRTTFRELTVTSTGEDPFDEAQAVAFLRRIPAEERAAFEATVRSDDSIEPEGYPDFRVVPPETPFDDLLVAEFVEPLEGNEDAFGFDIGSDERRRTAAELARDLGEAVATEPVDLVGDAPGQRGFLLIDAVYDTTEDLASRPSRRRHFVGVVVSVEPTLPLVEDVAGPDAAVEVEIYDLGPTAEQPIREFGDDNLVFDADDDRFVSPDGSVDGLDRRLDIDVGGRRWSMVFRPTEQFPTSGLPPWVVTVLGLVLTGAVALTISTVTDARRRAETLVDRRTADLRGLLASAPDATVVVDRNGSIVLASDRVRELLGYDPDDLVGRPVEDLVPIELRDRHVAHRDDFAAAPRNRMMGGARELAARHADGSSVPVEISLSSLPARSIGSVVAALRDVSAQREAYRELQRANEMQASFLGTISHELRTPLTAIEGFARLLIDQRSNFDEERQKEFIERIIRNSSNLRSLIEELLQFSQLERGNVVLEPERLDLFTLAEDVASQLGVVVETHEIEVEGRSAPVTVDRSSVTRVITNLLTNAVRYSPEGSRVRVTVEPSADGEAALLMVDDEGPGVAPEERERVFDRFWRGEQAQRMRQAGSGVGLAVVRELCEMAGGHVEVTDAPTGGARFVVELPATDDVHIRPGPAD